MKNLLFSLFVLFTAMFAGLRADVTSLTPDRFTLGTAVNDGTEVTSRFADGIYTVTVEKNLLMTNQTRGAHLKLDWHSLKGKSILFKAELRCKDIESFEKANHVGGKILCYIYGGGATNFRVTEALTGSHEKGNDVFYAYDLVNEPYQNGNATVSWWQIQADAAAAIREIDSEVPLLMEGNYCTTPVGYEMAPLLFKNIIYTIHMYSPNDYTHQGIRDELYVKTFPERAFDYRDRGWTREKLREAMKPAIDFQQKYHAKMQVGEFSATIWAPGAAQWLDDVIFLFEENHWDWTYHAFREWSGWSLEHEGTPTQMTPAEATDRMQVLQKYWNRNTCND